MPEQVIDDAGQLVGGGDNSRLPEDTIRRLVKRLEHLGYHATLQSLPTAVRP
jgi:hypothetical protein